MNRDQARNLIKTTFTRPFDKEHFRTFTLNVLNRIDESKAQAWNTQYIKDAFKPHVQRYERLGTYTSPERQKLDVLIVHLTSGSKLERTRTAIRNFVADHLKTRDEKDAALVAFVSPTEKQWRFSYVKMEYATVLKESGKAGPERSQRVGVETRLTPARRFSYLVGEGESSHTAQSRFVDLLQDTQTDPSLAQIEEAFSVEAVTKEFFTKYAELFEQINKALTKLVEKDKAIRDEFKAKNVNSIDFAKKLMGQIVFLYFLQKKGWLGVEKGNEWGTGPRDFLRRLADGQYGKYDNFFNDGLEPLFYDTLATDRGHEAWDKRFKCRIPFLNGGLFEPLGDYDWRKTDIVLPNKLFTNNEFVEEGITGTGVLDVFDRYNFTVNEAEPLEKEVAIDPEMLGKVFENLIEENRRKGLGAYYTPREIVHYMCQESLINYLDTTVNKDSDLVPRADIETFVHLGEQYSFYETAKQSGTIGRDYPEPPKSIRRHSKLIDDKLKEIAVCDPAVGSGAFPVGMMTEIVRARIALTPYFNDPHERSPYFFKRHAIQNCLYGVDIDPGAVEIAKLRLWLSLVVDEEDVKRIKPLPNLDYRIVVGDSLIGLPDGIVRNTKLEDEIERLKKEVFNETDREKKKVLRGRIDGKIKELLGSAEQFTGYSIRFDYRLFFSEVFHGKDGFDVTIANPPYVRQEKLKDLKPILARTFETYTGVADLYVYFYERGIKLLHPGGCLAFISSNKFFRAGYGEKLRKFLTNKAVITTLIDFGDLPVFEATTYPCVLIAKRAVGANGEAVVHARTIVSEEELNRFDDIFRSDAIEMPQSSLSVEGWRIEDRTALRLLEKIKKAGVPLGEYVEGKIFYGIKTGYNEAFIIDEVTKSRLITEDKKSAEVIKPFLRGRDIKRYAIEDPGLSIIYVPFQWTNGNRGRTEPEKFFKKELPATHRHLKQFEKQLMARDDQGDYWWEMRPCKYLEEFEKPKIMLPDISPTANFALDASESFCGNTAYIIPIADQLLLSVLNSTVSTYFYSKLSSTVRGGYLRFIYQYLSQIPIPKPNQSNREAIEERVEKILAAKRRDPKANTTALEREIDQIVYKLYGLTEEEIKIVEGASK